jgi:hypothetical protein
MKKRLLDVWNVFIKSSVNVSLMAPVLATAALIGVVLTVLQVESVVRDGATNFAKASKQKSTARIVRSPVSQAHYVEMADVLSRMNPAVAIAPGAKGSTLVIAVPKAELQPEWVYVLSTLQSHQPGVIWEAETICMRKCPNGQAAMAELRGYTQAVRM